MSTRTKRRACDGKLRHATRDAAAAALRALIRKGLAYHGQMTVYACNHCGGHHLGHRRRRRR